MKYIYVCPQFLCEWLSLAAKFCSNQIDTFCHNDTALGHVIGVNAMTTCLTTGVIETLYHAVAIQGDR